MRRVARSAAPWLGAALALWAGAAPAQTTVNPGALDQLAPPPARSTPAPKKPATHTKPTAKTAPRPPAKPSKPAAPPPVVPKAAPPAPVLPPPIVVPTRPPAPPAPVVVAPDAPGEATARSDGLRVSFGVGRADFNPASVAAIKSLAHTPAAPTSTFAVTAYAGGNADDPSTPRRLSLSRALAVRSLLLGEGIASERIYVRALGVPPAVELASPDRVDIAVTTPPAAKPP